LFYNYGKKSGFYYGILLDFEVQGNIKHLVDWLNLGFHKVNGTVSFLIQIDFGKAKVAVGINPGLLVNSTQTFNSSYIEGILAKEITGIISFNMGLFLFFYLSEIPLGDDRVIRLLLGIEETVQTMIQVCSF